jgi:hypothetical protein
LTNCTLVGNYTLDGAGGSGGYGLPAGSNGQSGSAEGQAFGSNTVNTLLAGDTPADTVIGGVSNLISSTAAGLIGPLAANGGPTLTMALVPGSPAIGAGDSAAAPPTDQRGYPRPSGSADIGAFEFGYPPLIAAVEPAGAGVNISVSGRAGQTCRLLISLDLIHWTPAATNVFGPQGSVLFYDNPPPRLAGRFYRVVTP